MGRGGDNRPLSPAHDRALELAPRLIAAMRSGPSPDGRAFDTEYELLYRKWSRLIRALAKLVDPNVDIGGPSGVDQVDAYFIDVGIGPSTWYPRPQRSPLPNRRNPTGARQWQTLVGLRSFGAAACRRTLATQRLTDRRRCGHACINGREPSGRRRTLASSVSREGNGCCVTVWMLPPSAGAGGSRPGGRSATL